MRLHAAVRPTHSPPLLLRSAPCQSPSGSGIPLALRFCAPCTEMRRKRQSGAVRCSISQVHSYGTVDYERRPQLKWSTLYRRISVMENPNAGSSAVLQQWEGEERQLSKWDLCRVIKELRKYGRFKRALEISDWMKSCGSRFAFNSGDEAIQLDLLAKVHGISHAEEYFSKLPPPMKDRRTYGALLNAYSQAKMRAKAEQILEQMKAEGFGYEVLPFNIMMTLYLNIEDHNRVFSLINEMKEKLVPFDVYSYNIWITNCAAVGDVAAMEMAVQEMIADTRVNMNWTTYTTLATMYIRLDEFEKAKSCLIDAELRMTGRDRTPFNYLLGLYSLIGGKDEVYRTWSKYKAAFRAILNSGYQSMLSALVKLGDTEGVKRVYKEWLAKSSKLDPRICNVVMRFYLKEGGISDAKKALDFFIQKGGTPKPLSWEMMAGGFLSKRRLSEALACMAGAASCKGLKNWRPRLADVKNIIELCTERNDSEGVRLLIDVLRRTDCLEKEEYKPLIA